MVNILYEVKMSKYFFMNLAFLRSNAYEKIRYFLNTEANILEHFVVFQLDYYYKNVCSALPSQNCAFASDIFILKWLLCLIKAILNSISIYLYCSVL